MPKRKYLKKTYKKNKGWSFFNVLIVSLLVCFFCGALYFVYSIKDLPRPEKFTEGDIFQSTKIFDRTGKVLLYEISGAEKRTLVSLNDIPEFLKQAVIAIEDREFFEHKGLDFRGIFRAILYDLKIKEPAQGASTITQQLIRSYFLTRRKTLKRKTQEIVLSLEIERRYSKEQILEWYLNIIPFGSNIYGVEAASQSFFGKNVSDISLAEAAILTALIQAPSYFSPYGDYKNELLKRKDLVIETMSTMNFITEEEAKESKNEKINFQPQITSIKAPHFVFFVKRYLVEKYGEDFLTRKGLKVFTTLDFEMQEIAEKAVEDHIKQVEYIDLHNAALVSANPKTGEILAMVGSKDYFGEPEPEGCTPGVNCKFDPQVNAAIALRQPGSSIKPFVYAKALQKGLTPKSIIWDVKTEFNLNCSADADQEFGEYDSKCYHPQNYDERFLGPVNLRTALAQSRNLPSVKILYLAGLNDVLDSFPYFGITSLKDKERYGLSLVLGGGEVSLLEMVQGFSVFAQDGIKTSLNFIKKIEDAQGKVIEETKTNQTRVISSQIAREINDILSDNEARTPVFGGNSSLYLENYQAAAKTGTTQDYKDGWIIGYTPNLITGVWAGNNDNTPIKKEPGVVSAGPIWKYFMKNVLEKFSKEDFIKPEERTSEIPILNGVLQENHSILYYLNQNDSQLYHWEKGIANFLQRK